MSLLKVIFLIFLFLSSALSGKSPQIMDPIQHLYTLNSHGAFADDKFELPENVYVLIPHTKGLEIPYVLNLPPEEIFRRKDIHHHTTSFSYAYDRGMARV